MNTLSKVGQNEEIVSLPVDLGDGRGPQRFSFHLRRLSLRHTMQRAVQKAQFLGGFYCVRDAEGRPTGQGVSWDTEDFAEMVAHVCVSVVQGPEWWKGEDTFDESLSDALPAPDVGARSLVAQLYREVVRWQTSFRAARREAGAVAAGGREGMGAGFGAGPDAGQQPLPAAMVDQDMRARAGA